LKKGKEKSRLCDRAGKGPYFRSSGKKKGERERRLERQTLQGGKFGKTPPVGGRK